MQVNHENRRQPSRAPALLFLALPHISRTVAAVLARAVVLDSLACIAKAQLSAYLKDLPLPESISRFLRLTGADLLKLSRSDLVQICGTADGIRLSNALKARSVRPRLILYISREVEASGDDSPRTPVPAIYQELYLEELTAAELTNKLAELLSLPANQIQQVSRQGPAGIHILVSDQMVRNLPDESCFIASVTKAQNSEGYHLVLK